MTMAKQAHPLGLYLHIPFCISRIQLLLNRSPIL